MLNFTHVRRVAARHRDRNVTTDHCDVAGDSVERHSQSGAVGDDRDGRRVETRVRDSHAGHSVLHRRGVC